MNLKKTVFSLFAATAIVGSMVMPAYAEDTEKVETTSQGTAGEDGNLSFSLTGTVVFNPVEVTSKEGATATQSTAHNLLSVNDSYSYNPNGYSLQLTASNLNDGDGHFIDVKYMGVARDGINNHSSCLTGGALPVEGNNPYQTVTRTINSPGVFSPMTDGVTLIEATSGRGCMGFQTSYVFELNVPAGTYTGGDEAVYTGDVTLSNVPDVGEGS